MHIVALLTHAAWTTLSTVYILYHSLHSIDKKQDTRSNFTAMRSSSSASSLDAEAPRTVQWESDDALEENYHDDLTSRDFEGTSSSGGQTAKKPSFSSLSFGSLRKAREALGPDSSDENSEEYDDVGSESSDQETEIRSTRQSSLQKKPQRRMNKNAPVEMSSKKPVTRKRQVVETKKLTHRDPRFVTLSGEYKPELFHTRYAFLADMHKNELTALKDNLKRARTMLRSSPRDQREAREEEVANLERALKRAESQVNKDTMNDVERSALHKLRTTEKDKQKQGKAAWYMKSSEKKGALIRARHDALLERGGKIAVRKAIEKKQKKISQKEKKRRPSFDSRVHTDNIGNAGPSKRRRV